MGPVIHNQGDQMFLEKNRPMAYKKSPNGLQKIAQWLTKIAQWLTKIAQNVAQPIFCHRYVIHT
jgi:hypothetical protein